MTEVLTPSQLDIARFVRSGDTIVLGQGTAEPSTLLDALIDQRQSLGQVNVFVGGVSYSERLQPQHADHLNFLSYGAVGQLRKLAAAGVLNILPCHLSHLPKYFAEGLLRVDVLFVQVSPPNEEGQYSLGLADDYLQAAISAARIVVAEVNEQVPWTYCDRPLTSDRIDIAVHTSRPPLEVEASSASDVERHIAENVCRYIDDGSVLQVGIGGVPDAVLDLVKDRRDLGIHSGLIGDKVAELMQLGVISNARKSIDPGVSVTGVLFGTRRLYKFAHRNEAIRLRAITYTHAPGTVCQLKGLVAINSAVEVDLTGQVNAETVNQRFVGAVGGQVDFVRASQLSPGGRSIIALPSMARDRSRIVYSLAGPVTTARSDADVVATEHGVAELRGQPLAERVRRMIAISDPKVREQLEASCKQASP